MGQPQPRPLVNKIVALKNQPAVDLAGQHPALVQRIALIGQIRQLHCTVAPGQARANITIAALNGVAERQISMVAIAVNLFNGPTRAQQCFFTNRPGPLMAKMTVLPQPAYLPVAAQ